MSTKHTPFLKVSGSHIVDDNGDPVVLRGIGLAGWLLMENWITGFPGHEEGQETAIRHVLGPDLTTYFYERFIENFFSEADAAYLASLGINLVRIPFHYKFLESDDRPFEIKPDGFRHLDRVIALCARHGIRTMLDLHAVPGYQNQDWHSDNPTHVAHFWRHPHFQDRVANLWRAIATHYRDEPWVIGYNPLNEPADPTAKRVGPVYRRLVETIREVDDKHIIFLDGNRYAMDFHFFGEPMPNVIYSPHDYPPPGFMPGSRYPGSFELMHVVAPEEGSGATAEPPVQFWDKAAVEGGFLDRVDYMQQTGTPIVVGEFNAVFTGEAELDQMRLNLLADQLDIYDKHQASWVYWGYKDIGVVSPLTVAADSLWMRRIRPVVEKKARLAVDLWGGDLARIADVLEPVRAVIAREFPDWCPFPWGADFQINRLIPHTLFSQAMLPEFGELFRGMTESDIDEMMRSFRLENCLPRTPLIELLTKSVDDATSGPADA
ncbi:cellulase family glycosylhydrolase [Solwaraspora sp. WMMD406]|uniref:glycoside hydrolase family 5 protein n=1 Tax=Solwaraspora sp. WMMD406 TaxID=3016095 RepID=UPI0024162633|nr:cellulase family glycosylhydrolase [Solwaraspora sp. WMMD406]MDG4765746.1 cellulase family glycosylhydrolase [Solwaraspora sp. WMMD406]